MSEFRNFNMSKDKIMIRCKKAWKGMIDVRSHVCKLAEDKNLPIEITCDAFEGTMTIKPEDLRKFDKVSKEYTGMDDIKYKLISYKWKQD